MTSERVAEKSYKNWSEAVNSLLRKVADAGRKLHNFRNITEEDFDVKVEKVVSEINTRHDHLDISFDLTRKELKKAPQEIKMLMDDLGLTVSDKIDLKVSLLCISYTPPERFTDFSLIIRPKEISFDKLGIMLGSKGSTGVFAPDGEVFNVPRQYVEEFFSRGDKVARIYSEELSGGRSSIHPFMVEIVSAAADWVTDMLNNRRRTAKQLTPG